MDPSRFDGCNMSALEVLLTAEIHIRHSAARILQASIRRKSAAGAFRVVLHSSQTSIVTPPSSPGFSRAVGVRGDVISIVICDHDLTSFVYGKTYNDVSVNRSTPLSLFFNPLELTRLFGDSGKRGGGITLGQLVRLNPGLESCPFERVDYGLPVAHQVFKGCSLKGPLTFCSDSDPAMKSCEVSWMLLAIVCERMNIALDQFKGRKRGGVRLSPGARFSASPGQASISRLSYTAPGRLAGPFGLSNGLPRRLPGGLQSPFFVRGGIQKGVSSRGSGESPSEGSSTSGVGGGVQSGGVYVPARRKILLSGENPYTQLRE